MTTRPAPFKLSWPSATTLLVWLLPVFAWAPLTYGGYFELHSGFLAIFNLNDLLGHLTDLSWAPTVGQPYDLLRGERVLPYLLAASPRLMDVSSVTAVKLVYGLSLLVAALGMYGWARRRLGAWAGVLAAAVYIYGPILLATTYVRGAFAEAVLLGLLPWVLWAAEAARAGSRRGAVGLAVGLAAALWTQAGLALWQAGLVLVWVGWPRPSPLKSSARSGTSRLKPAGMPLAGWAGGLALGALGLLPVILQHGWGGATYVDFVDHFVYPHQLLLAGWGSGPSLAGPDDTLTFSLGLVAFSLAVLAFLVPGASATDRAPEGDTAAPDAARAMRYVALAVILLLVLLATNLTTLFWRLLPFLAQSLTYPWQLLLLALPWLAWLAGAGGERLLRLAPAATREQAAVPLCAGLLAATLLGAYGDVQPAFTRVPVPAAPLAIYGDNEIALISAIAAGSPGPGGRLTLVTRWQALRPLDQDYTVFFHAIGQDGVRYGQQDTMPQGGKLPTSRWQPGQVVADQYQVVLSADAPIGADGYQCWLGLYQVNTGQRLTTGSDDKVVVTP